MFMPQVGQTLHFFLSGRGPLAATVAKVHSPRSVTLSYLDENGDSFPHHEPVAVVQDEQEVPETYAALPVEQPLPEEDPEPAAEAAE